MSISREGYFTINVLPFAILAASTKATNLVSAL